MYIYNTMELLAANPTQQYHICIMGAFLFLSRLISDNNCRCFNGPEITVRTKMVMY